MEYVASQAEGKGVYEVTKISDLDNWKTVTLDPLNCDCGDAVYHNQICKHLIAALYADGDQEAVKAYAELEGVI